MRKTLLAIGDLMMTDRETAPSLNRFIAYGSRLWKRSIGFKFITYDDALTGRLPNIYTKRLDIMLFFPYNHWNGYIERYDRDERIYGDSNFGREYGEFFRRLNRIIRKRYRKHSLRYVSSPASCVLDRDKLGAYRLLKRNGVKTPCTYSIKRLSQIERLLESQKGLYIKPVFGSMGKGITYIDKKSCRTNFIFKDGKILSKPYDYNWGFRTIPRDKRGAFLSVLIRRKFMFQQAVEFPVINNRRFDTRVYVINGKIPYMYAKSAPDTQTLTNWSQGGRIENRRFLKKALSENTIGRIKAVAKRGAAALKLKYAGVDVVIDRNTSEVYLLELHSFPGYERGFNLMKAISDAI